jgi:hypothetical protein
MTLNFFEIGTKKMSIIIANNSIIIHTYSICIMNADMCHYLYGLGDKKPFNSATSLHGAKTLARAESQNHQASVPSYLPKIRI